MKKDHNPSSNAAALRRRAEEKLQGKQKGRRKETGAREAQLEAQQLVHELQVHQIELEMQNDELQQSRAEVETLLGQYKDLYDFAPVGYVTLDSDEAIRRVNLTGALLLGEDRNRLINRRFGLFISKADRPAFHNFLQGVFANRDIVSGKSTCEVTLDKVEDRPPASETQRQGGIDETRRQVRIEAQVTEDRQECRAVIIDITRRRKAEAALQETHARLERNLKGAIDVIAETIERKGPYPPGRHRRIAALASAIAREMGLTDFQVQGIELAAAIYDIGMIYIPIELLQNTDRLEGTKSDLYHDYPQNGHDILKKIEFLWPIADIVLQHRECFDGSGFPQGLKGADILIETRVLAVADALEDLMTHRSFRNAFPLIEALENISSNSGSKYDPNVVDACLKLFKEKGYKMEG